jgi:tetratricopeptide (TPR) repeat protein
MHAAPRIRYMNGKECWKNKRAPCLIKVGYSEEMISMCYIKRFFESGILFFLFAMFSGCATVPTNKTDYYPKIPLNIKNIEEAVEDLTVLIRKNEILFYPNIHDDPDIYSSISKDSFAGYDVGEYGYSQGGLWLYSAKNIDVTFNGIDFPLFPFSYNDLSGFKIMVSLGDGGHMVRLPKDRAVSFRIVDNEAAAHRMADDLFYIQQNLDNLDKYNEDKLAAFKETADQYRALKVKPPVSEEQRKFIVQANALTEQKDYTGAIDHYKKAIELDQTSYPAAYYNMALLYAREHRFRLAIEYMNRYLLLEPEAKDARSAQDKIYEWEATLEK